MTLSRINWTQVLKCCTDSGARWYLDTATGAVVCQDRDASGQFRTDLTPLPFAHHSTQFQWMRDFIEEVESPGLREALRDVTTGAGAFSRFKSELSYHPSEKGRWLHYRTLRIRSVIEDWLIAQGLDLTPPWSVPDSPLDLSTIPLSVLRHEMQVRGVKTYEEGLQEGRSEQ